MNELPIRRLMDAVRADNEPLPSHIHVLRVGFLSQFTELALECLRAGLMADDPAIIQGATTVPSPTHANKFLTLEACDPLIYGLWKASELDSDTVDSAEECFAQLCFQAEELLGEPAACRHWLNWADDTTRDNMRRVLLAEVERELERRFAAIAGEVVRT